MFYGTIGVLLGIFLLLTIFWNVGSGYSECNGIKQKISIYRKGFPGKNSEFFIKVGVNDLRSIKIRNRKAPISKQTLSLGLQNKKEIPLIESTQAKNFSIIEKEALKICQFLSVRLKSN